MSRQTVQRQVGRSPGFVMTEEHLRKRQQAFNETIAKRKRKSRSAPMTREEVIAKIIASPGIRTTEVTGGRNVNLKLITVMAKSKEIIRKVPRTGNGYELYLPEARKEA